MRIKQSGARGRGLPSQQPDAGAPSPPGGRAATPQRDRPVDRPAAEGFRAHASGDGMPPAEPPAGDTGLAVLRRRAAEQLEREAGWLRALTADYAGQVDAATRIRGTARLDSSRDRAGALRRLRIATRNCEARLQTAERAAAAAEAPDLRFIRAVLGLRHAVFDAVEIASMGRLGV